MTHTHLSIIETTGWLESREAVYNNMKTSPANDIYIVIRTHGSTALLSISQPEFT